MITDPQAISFCNEQIRPLANSIAQTYKLAKQTAFLFTAKGYAALIPNDATLVADGAARADGGPPDGRTAINGADVLAILTIAAQMVATNEANGNALILQIGKVATEF